MSYSYKEFFQQFYRAYSCSHGCHVTDTESYVLWKTESRKHLTKLLGLSQLETFVTNSKPYCRDVICLDAVKENGYTRYKMQLQTLPSVWMPFYMLVPEGVSSSTPRRAMISIPAHGANKESVCGVLSSPGVKEKLQNSPKENYGQRFAQKGYIVFSPDPPGYGERIEPLSMEGQKFLANALPNPLGSSCKNLTMTAEAMGLTFAGLVLWDMMRLLDYIETLSIVDSQKLGCCGFSGGGLYTLWLAAMDDRIRLAIISGYLHSAQGSIMETHLCPCNFVPQLWLHYDLCDIASLIAPRPVFFENGISDTLNGPNGIDDPIQQFHKIQNIYSLFNQSQNVQHVAFDGPHMWNGSGYDFADKHLI